MPQDPPQIGAPPKKPWEYLIDPIIPKETIEPLQDYIDSPSLDRSPWEARLAGFGAGALEGLREQFTPINLLAASGPAAARLALMKPSRGLLGTGKTYAERAASSLPPKPPVQPSLGELLPEATPVGGEYIYNLGRKTSQLGKEFNPLETLGPRMGGRAQ